jgi:hypothetical protein
MTSQDTLGGGVTANAGSGVNATVNASVPDLGHTWNMRVSSIGGGLGLPGFALTGTYTPQQIADFLNRYILSPLSSPAPNNGAELVRDSASAAGVPSRNNVFEYGFPDSRPAPSTVFNSGASPVPYLPAAPQPAGGTPGISANGVTPPAGGLLGLIQNTTRNNPDGGSAP